MCVGQGQMLWDNLIDTQRVYEFPVEMEVSSHVSYLSSIYPVFVSWHFTIICTESLRSRHMPESTLDVSFLCALCRIPWRDVSDLYPSAVRCVTRIGRPTRTETRAPSIHRRFTTWLHSTSPAVVLALTSLTLERPCQLV